MRYGPLDVRRDFVEGEDMNVENDRRFFIEVTIIAWVRGDAPAFLD